VERHRKRTLLEGTCCVSHNPRLFAHTDTFFYLSQEFEKLVRKFGKDRIRMQFGREKFSWDDLLVDAINECVEGLVGKRFDMEPTIETKE
jgi:hypothetical protein